MKSAKLLIVIGLLVIFGALLNAWILDIHVINLVNPKYSTDPSARVNSSVEIYRYKPYDPYIPDYQFQSDDTPSQDTCSASVQWSGLHDYKEFEYQNHMYVTLVLDNSVPNDPPVQN